MKMNKIISLFMLLCCLLAFSTTAYAFADPDEGEVPIQTVQEESPAPQALTPEGNMSLVDDIQGDTAADKQFITVVTKNGNYFYIIIDNAEDGESTVHFLNQVDERDLLALMEDEESETVAVPTCVCTDKCVAGKVNTSCPVCKTDMTQCTGKETAPTAPAEVKAEPEPDPETKSGGLGGIIVLVLIAAVLGGGGFYYFKFIKNKPSAKGKNDLDDYNFGDEDEDDEEPEDDEIALDEDGQDSADEPDEMIEE